MAGNTHTPAEQQRTTQPAPSTPDVEEAPQSVLEETIGTAAGAPGMPIAPGDPDAAAARHASMFSDPRIQRTSVTQRARMVQQLQRGYGNQHVARAMAQRVPTQNTTADPRPLVQRKETPSEEGAPTPAQKEAALRAAAAAEALAGAAKGKGDGQAAKAKGAAASEKSTAQAAKAKAAAAGGAAQAAAKQKSNAAKGARTALASLGKTRQHAAPAAASAVAPPPGKAPARPEQDSAFQAVVAKTRRIGARQRTTAPASSKAAAAQAAAISPTAELAGQSQDAQVGKMQQAETPAFNATGFKAKLMEKIASLAPKTVEEADKFKEGGKLNGVKGEMQGTVAEEQKKSEGPLEQQANAAPDASAAKPKPVAPLQPETAGPVPEPVGAAGAAPKPRTAAEVEQPVREAPKQIDQQMQQADVTEKTLAESNEPAFQTALDAKKDAKAHAQSAPGEFRQAEGAQLESARTEAEGTAQAQTAAMHTDRASVLGKVAGQQGQTKSKDEQERARIGAEIQTIYSETKTTVEAKLAGLDGKVDAAFDEGAAAAKKTFEDYVTARMDAYKEKRYGGWLGWARWAKDKIAGMPGEVNAFYAEGRNLYLKEMDAVIDRVVQIVGSTITEAKAEVARGRQRIKEYVSKLPANLQKVGQEAASEADEQLNGLADQIQSKEGELIDRLAQKYQENLQSVDARIDELKAANKGLVDKAIDAVAGVIKTIMQLKDMLLGVLAKAADAVGKIIKDPIGFLGNLISGVKQGLQGFLSNIGTHIQKGLMTWLLGEVAEGGIELPKSFDIKGILMMVMQMLGATWENLQARAVKMFGAPAVEMLKKGFHIFQIIQSEGIGGLWEFVKDQLGNLKDMIMDGIKDMVITQVIQAGIQWLMGVLGGPAGAFIKACKAIIDIVMWFINNGARVMSLVNSILDSVSAIANGSVGEAAKFIEASLAKAIPVVIGFLASLLGLGGFGAKIKAIIQKVQAPISKAIDWVLGKAKGFVSKIMGKVKGAFGKKDSPQEKEKQLKAGLAAGVAAVNKYAGKRVGAVVLKPILGALKIRYRLSVLEPFEKSGYWAVRADIRRMADERTDAKSGDDDKKEIIFVERNQIFVHDKETANAFTINIFAKVPGSKDAPQWGIVDVPLETPEGETNPVPKAKPGPTMVLENAVTVDGKPVKLKMRDGSFTDIALRIMLSKCEKKYGHKLEELSGSLARSNLANFQKEYAQRFWNLGMSEDDAKNAAIRVISFGIHRISLKYDKFEVELDNYGEVDIPGMGRMKRIPRKVNVTAKRSS